CTNLWSNMSCEAEIFAVPGKIALWLEDPTKANLGSQPEDTVGLRLRDQASGQEVFYIPGCADLPPALADRINGAKVVLFDGTTFTNAEMHEQGVGEKTAQRMGHLAMHGPEGSMAAFSSLDVGRRIYVHINNTNPVLCEDSPERAAVVAAGWEVAFDGMEITP
ncbi:MAG: MBL fold metallo-hydrolase, partial [Rhodospirillaceae bacterium]